jgi:hypothetical protein
MSDADVSPLRKRSRSACSELVCRTPDVYNEFMITGYKTLHGAVMQSWMCLRLLTRTMLRKQTPTVGGAYLILSSTVH